MIYREERVRGVTSGAICKTFVLLWGLMIFIGTVATGCEKIVAQENEKNSSSKGQINWMSSKLDELGTELKNDSQLIINLSEELESKTNLDASSQNQLKEIKIIGQKINENSNLIKQGSKQLSGIATIVGDKEKQLEELFLNKWSSIPDIWLPNNKTFYFIDKTNIVYISPGNGLIKVNITQSGNTKGDILYPGNSVTLKTSKGNCFLTYFDVDKKRKLTGFGLSCKDENE